MPITVSKSSRPTEESNLVASVSGTSNFAEFEQCDTHTSPRPSGCVSSFSQPVYSIVTVCPRRGRDPVPAMTTVFLTPMAEGGCWSARCAVQQCRSGRQATSELEEPSSARVRIFKDSADALVRRGAGRRVCTPRLPGECEAGRPLSIQEKKWRIRVGESEHSGGSRPFSRLAPHPW
jgi:hypothetical protein